METDRQQTLFPLPEPIRADPLIKPIRHPLWTESKAKLVQKYLHLFLMITKHGTYIDGFAGPQEAGRDDMWAAKLVLEMEPRWLRNFFLFDASAKQVAELNRLVACQPPRTKKEPSRQIVVEQADSNDAITRLVTEKKIAPNEATFCLLDQRTFECHWSTLEALAAYKMKKNKIELFYFLANHWFSRAISAQKDTSVLDKWWGNSTWTKLQSLKPEGRAEAVATRMKEELGYSHALAWPIFQKEEGGGSVMYYMIHATDHDEAPKLMRRAYEKALPGTTEIQLQLPIE